MNIIDETFNEKKINNKGKKAPKIILALIILLVIGIIAVVVGMAYIDKSTLKVYVDDTRNDNVKNMLVFEGDTIYVPIRDIAEYLGYKSYNGDYAEKSEEKNKCYVEGENEVATFSLNSNKIYKIETSSGATYQYYYCKKPVKSINGKLYVSSDGIEEAFNISFINETDKYRIRIYTMPILISSYKKSVLDWGYEEMSNIFNNQKSIFINRLIVSKEKNKSKMGIVDLDGKIIAEPKYDNITYLPETEDFLVTSNKKVGVMSKDGTLKVQIVYDDIDLMDKDAGLYLAKRENKYGIVDIKGNVKLYIQYDQIGIDIVSYAKNEIKSKYLLVDNLIPVKKDGLWGLFNKSGKQIVDFQYDGFGYVATSNKDAFNLLVIPDYNVMVTKKNNKYGLINSSGVEIVPTSADDIYMTIDSDKKYYYLNILDKKYDVIEYLDSIGVKTTKDDVDNMTGPNVTENSNQNETKNNSENNNQEGISTENQNDGQSGEQNNEQNGEYDIQ